MLAWLSDLMAQGIEFFFALTGNYGLAIIMLTVIIRVVLLPLTQMQVRSMRKMREISPQLEELNKKYKGNQQKLNEETVALWRKHKINPMAGCLPLLLQFPFLIALFRLLHEYPYQGAASFLWLEHLGRPDPYYILPVLAAVTTYFQSKVASGGPQEGAQQTMLYAMPVMIGWFSTRFASGLSLYWVIGNVFGIAEHYFMGRKKVD